MKTKLALWNTVSREEEHDYNKERRLRSILICQRASENAVENSKSLITASSLLSVQNFGIWAISIRFRQPVRTGSFHLPREMRQPLSPLTWKRVVWRTGGQNLQPL